MPVDTYILNGEHLEAVGIGPTQWRPEVPVEVFDPWLRVWRIFTSVIQARNTFIFVLDDGNALRTRNLTKLSVRIKEV